MAEKINSRRKQKSYEIHGQKFIIANDIEDITPISTTGFIDQWPAYSSQRMLSSNHIFLNKNRNMVVVNEKEIKLPNLIPKPKFLEYLEKYVENEMKKHGVEQVEPNPMRLEIYREAFDWLINAFKTYKPLFADIKREYDSMIAFLREEIRNLEPMKEMIWTISEERNQEILLIKQQEKEDITNLKAEKLLLMKTIGEYQANQKTLEVQIETLQRKLEEEHLAYRNEADARRLLIIDINDVRQQMDDLSALKKNQNVHSTEDPVIIKLALEQAKKGHSELLFEITKMKTDYAEVVPKRDYERLLEEFEKLSNSSSANSQKLVELDVEQQTLEERFTALQQQRDFYYSKYMELTKSSTPRPDWKKCGDILSGGTQWWQEQSKDKSSKDLVDLLLQEINMSASRKTQIDGQGLGTNVLPFLRTEGKVNLRSISKRDVKIHIREIWEGRKILKEEQNEAISKNKEYLLPPFTDYVDFFFKRTYGIEQIRYEWAYSFYEFISKESNDEKIVQFKNILNGVMDEDVYWEEMMFLNDILDKFKLKDPQSENKITKEDIKSVIQSLELNVMNEEIVNSMMDTIYNELSMNEEEFLPYLNLFLIDDEGEYGPFMSQIKILYKDDKLKYIQEIEKELRELGPKISPQQLQESIQIVDPQIPEELLNKYVSHCFESKYVPEVSKTDPIYLDSVVEKLKMGLVKRYRKKN